MPASRRIVLLLVAILVLLLFLAVPSVSWADSWEDSARELARKIAAVLRADASATGSSRSAPPLSPGEAVFLQLRNLSALGVLEVAGVRRAIEAELQGLGTRFAAESASRAKVLVTLAENLSGHLWVAEVRRQESNQVVMVAFERAPTARPRSPAPPLFLRKEFVWEQADPILDFALADAAGQSAAMLAVLSPTQVAVYEREAAGWNLRQAYPLTTSKPWPRDLRGQLRIIGDFLWVSLPGMRCHAQTRPAQPLGCEEGEKAWSVGLGPRLFQPAEFVSPRNYFSGAAGEGSGSEKLPPYYSLISFPEGPAILVILAGLDSVRVTEPAAGLLATVPGWGSDLVTLESPCGSGRQVLATRNGDWTEPDGIQAFEFVDRQPVPVSPRVDFEGPVTALWPALDGTTAHGVSRNLKTGRYEAYRLSTACSR